jgi:HSP20 family protein
MLFKGEKAMTLVKFNNNPSNTLLPGFNDVFESIFNDTFLGDRMVMRVPAVNISESENNYHVELAAPGLKKEDFKLNLDRNQLTISVEQPDRQDNQKNYSKREYSYTSFVRSFTAGLMPRIPTASCGSKSPNAKKPKQYAAKLRLNKC